MPKDTTWPLLDCCGLDYIFFLDCGKGTTLFNATDEHRNQRIACRDLQADISGVRDRGLGATCKLIERRAA